MSNNRNRTAGHDWEREVVRDLQTIFPDCVTSRSESKRLDDKGVDICYTGNFHFQCKNQATRPDYHKLISTMPKDKIAVVVHKYTKKQGSRFYCIGKYAIIDYYEFLKLLKNE